MAGKKHIPGPRRSGGHTHNGSGKREDGGTITIGKKEYKVTKVYCTCGTHVRNDTEEI